MQFVSRPADPVDDPLGLDPDLVWMSPSVSLWGWGESQRIHPGTSGRRIEVLGEGYRKVVSSCGQSGDAPVRGPILFSSATFATGSPGSIGVVPRLLLGRVGEEWWLTAQDGGFDLPEPVAEPPPPDRARYAGSTAPDIDWTESVAEAIRRIERGDLDKVVMARDYAVWSRTPFHPPRLLRHLRSRFPGCYVFRVAGMIGASPELLVRLRGNDFESQVLAGSVPSHTDPTQDAAAARHLLSSEKNNWEHELAVRSVAEALAAIDVEPDVGTPGLLRLDNVQHLATEVRAVISPGFDALGVAALLHPTAAVGGTPTETALDLIAELEGMDRGRYAGPVGWMGPSGDGELAIALRCAELSGARARLFAGAGVVRGSLPEAELEETRVKLGAMMGALAPSGQSD